MTKKKKQIINVNFSWIKTKQKRKGKKTRKTARLASLISINKTWKTENWFFFQEPKILENNYNEKLVKYFLETSLEIDTITLKVCSCLFV